MKISNLLPVKEVSKKGEKLKKGINEPLQNSERTGDDTLTVINSFMAEVIRPNV